MLVTGATGFVGSWLTKALVDGGAAVTALARTPPAPQTHGLFTALNPGGSVKLVMGRVTETEVLTRAIRDAAIDTCFHLAAQATVGDTQAAPAPAFDTNIRGTWSLLEACRVSQSVQRTVIASSSQVYATHPADPWTEDMPLLARHPYGASKICAEVIAGTYAETFGLHVGIARSANVYGPGDTNFSRIVPGTIRSALRGERPLIRSDGTAAHDYLYVGDLVSGYLALAEQLAVPGANGEAFNFGTGRPVSVLSIVQLILRLTGKDALLPQPQGPRASAGSRDESHPHRLSLEKAATRIGWKPVTSLEDGLLKTISWLRPVLAAPAGGVRVPDVPAPTGSAGGQVEETAR